MNVAEFAWNKWLERYISDAGRGEWGDAMRDAKLRILVVDDIQQNRMLLRFVLEKAGYGVILANHGHEALAVLAEHPVDLIISDILMPEMDGYQLCRECKAHAQWKDIPFIFFTATYTSKEDEDFSMALGANRFLLKPMPPKLLLLEVENVLREVAMGTVHSVQQPIKDTEDYLKLYNQRLVHKLEDKLMELEAKNKQLTEELVQRRRAEAKAELLLQAVESAGETIIITDSRGIVEYVNPAIKETTGFSVDELLGTAAGFLMGEGNNEPYSREIWETISSGKAWSGRFNARRKDGSPYPVMMTVSSMLDKAGGHVRYVAVQADLSRLEEMEQRFHQAQKMDALGTLVGGIAHDFNNMLASMTCNLYLAKQQIHAIPDAEKKISDVEQISFRASDMIRQLLLFARKGDIAMKPLPFNPLIKETLKFLRSGLPDNINLQQDISKEPLKVLGDATQIHQVLMNLLNNARDSLEGRENPSVMVKLEAFEPDEAWLAEHPDLKPGSYVHLSVKDNGCGIAEEHIAKLFEPFFTTKQAGKGTGLGLAMVFGAIKMHNGFVDVESEPGKGSIFHIYIPALQRSDIAAAHIWRDEVAIRGHGETILVVDNQQHLVDTLQEVLVSLNYRVLVAMNGESAVETFIDHADEIALTIMDLVMPVMDGDQAAEAVRLIREDAKIVFLTDYVQEAELRLVNEILLPKPFSIGEMSRLIRQQLDA